MPAQADRLPPGRAVAAVIPSFQWSARHARCVSRRQVRRSAAARSAVAAYAPALRVVAVMERRSLPGCTAHQCAGARARRYRICRRLPGVLVRSRRHRCQGGSLLPGGRRRQECRRSRSAGARRAVAARYRRRQDRQSDRPPFARCAPWLV
jgi:hypothetical protein